jgi:RHS repeat-associated protein
VNNLLFCSQDSNGFKTYYAYRASDRARIRTVRGLVTGFSLPDFAAVEALTRATTPNPDYVIEDVELDDFGELVAHIDGRGIRQEMVYNSRGQVVLQVAAFGAPSDGERPSVAARTEFEYDAQGNQVRVIRPRSFAVDASGTVFSRPGPEGDFITQVVYNGRNNMASRTEAFGRPEAATEQYSYYLDERVKDRIDPRGYAWTTRWRKCCTTIVAESDPPDYVDDSGTLKRATRVSGTDAFGNATYNAVVKDIPATPTQEWYRNPPESDTVNESTTRFDARNRPVARTVWLVPLSVENAWINPPIAGEGGIPPEQGLTTRWVYDENMSDGVGLDVLYGAYLVGLGIGEGAVGSMVEETSPAGRKSISISDALGRVVRAAKINGGLATSVTIDNVFDEAENGLVRIRNIRYPNGLGGGGDIMTQMLSDGAGRPRIARDAENFATNNGFDSGGNLVVTRDPNGVGFDAVFDDRNREITRVDTVGDRTAWNQYDAESNVIKTKDAFDHANVTVYDGRSNSLFITNRIGGVTVLKFDLNGNLLEIKDADVHERGDAQPTTVYRYGSRNQLVLEAYRDDTVEANYSMDEYVLAQFDQDDRRSYGYDAARRLTNRIDQAAVQTGYAYDMASRLLTRFYPDGLNNRYQYDADDHLIMATSTRYTNSVAYGYDNVGRLVSEQITIAGVNYLLSYGFDATNRKVSEVYPNGQSMVRMYTDRDQLASVSFGGSAVVSSFAYDNGGRETSRTLANGVTQSRTWRSDNLPSTITAPGVTNLSYSWDANKRKTAETNGLFAAQTNSYTGYDNEDRLTAWQRGNGDTQTWGLSQVGDWNNTVVNGIQEDRTHNTAHEILTATPPNPAAQLIHDAKGNLTHNKNGHDYSWDIENRLAQVVVHAGELGIAGTHTYSYDALGRRVSKTANDVMTVFVNNAYWQEVAEYQLGELVQNYVFGDYIDEVLAMVKASGAWHFYFTNDLYSIYALTDSTGAVIETYKYDPYGKPDILAPDDMTIRISSSAGNPWGFTGRRHDTETGIMYYRARMYDFLSGRFISRDPLSRYDGRQAYYTDPSDITDGRPSDFSRYYQYVGGAPAKAVDPLGLQVMLPPTDVMRENLRCGQVMVDIPRMVRGALDFVDPTLPGRMQAAIAANPASFSGWIVLRFKPDADPSCSPPCCPGGGWGWIFHRRTGGAAQWGRDTAAHEGSDPTQNPQPVETTPEPGTTLQSWYSGQAWDNAGNEPEYVGGRRQARPVRPSPNVADLPVGAARAEFIAQLVCESTGEVFFNYRWTYGGADSGIDANSCRQDAAFPPGRILR